MPSPKVVMSITPLDPQRSTRCLKTVNADEDAGIHVGELDFSVLGFPVSPVSSESSMSSNENKDGKRRGLLQRSQHSLRNLLGKPSYKEMTDSAFSVLSEEASSPKEDMNDTRGMLTRSKGSLQNLLLKSSSLKVWQDDEHIGRNETKDRRSKPETVTTDTKDRTKHHKRAGSFDQLLGRESVRESRSIDNLEATRKALRPERRRSISNDKGLKPERRRSISNDKGLRPERRRSISNDKGLKPERRRSISNDKGLRPERRRSISNDKGLRPEGRRSRSGDNLQRMSNSQRPEGRKTRSGDSLEKMRNSLRSEGQKPRSRRNNFRSDSFKMKGQKKEGRRDSVKLAQMFMAEFANFED
jgi:hypothetical protein